MTDAPASLPDKLTALAHSIADSVLNDKDCPVETRIAALQRLSAFYALLHRIEPEETPGSSFGSYKNDIASANGQRAARQPGRANGSGNAERPYAIVLHDE